MGSWDRKMRERGENQREKKGGGASCLEKLDSQRSVYLFKRGLSSASKIKYGDYGRSEETLCHPTRRLSPLCPPSPSLSVSMNIQFTPMGPAGTMDLCATRIQLCKNTPVYSF